MHSHHYNIFLNYRRSTGRDFARTLQQAFKARGFSVFFDYDSLQDGKFNEKIFSAIENCDVFVVAYSEDFFDRCVDENDWVRGEIEYAFAHGKKVIPVAPTNMFAHMMFPENLPSVLAQLRDIQTSEIHVGMLFDESVDHCVESRFPAALKHLSPARTGKFSKPSIMFSGRHALHLSFAFGILVGLLAGLVVYDTLLGRDIIYRTLRYCFSLF